MIQETPLDKLIAENRENELEPLIGPNLPNLDNIEAPIPNNSHDDIEDEELTNLTGIGSFSNLGTISAGAKMEEEQPMLPTPEEF
jgi:hypothetical protein